MHQCLIFLDSFHFAMLSITAGVQASTTLFITSGNTFVNSPRSCSGNYCVCCLCPFVFTFVPPMCIWNFVSPLCAKMFVQSEDDFEVCGGQCDLPTFLPFIA